MTNPIEWPKTPKEGDVFTHVDTISGADYCTAVFKDGKWAYMKPDEIEKYHQQLRYGIG